MKRFVCLWVAVMILCSVCFVSPAAAAIDPYNGINALDFDGKKTDNRFRTDEGCLGGMYTSHYVYYKNVDFGDTSPSTVTVSIGVPEAYRGRIELCLDSPSSAAIASIVPEICNWLTPLNNTVELTQKVTGVHDLYLVVKENTQNVFSIKFNRPAGDGIYTEYREESLFNDIGENKYKQEIELVSQLGFMGTDAGGVFRPSITMTKGEFAEILYKIWNETKINYEPVYSDIPEDSEYANACVFLKKIGILPKGEADFKPYSYITPDEAAVLLCRALGYADLIDEIGEAQAIKTVTSMGLLRGLPNDKYLKRDACAAMLYKGLTSEYTYISEMGERNRYSKNKDGILSQMRSVYFGRGIVNKTCITGLYSPESDLAFGNVELDGVRYSVGETNAAAYFGYECDYFYHEENGKRTIVAIRPADGAETLWITDDELVTINSNEIKYSKASGRVKKIKLPSNARIIFNGKALDDELEGALPASGAFQGKIRCVDSGDGFDTFFIDSYVNMLVSGVDSKDILHDSLSNKTVDLSTEQLVLQRDGNEATPQEIETNDAAVVYESANKSGEKLVRVYLRSKTIDGIVTKIDKTGTAKTIDIDDVTYTVAPESKAVYAIDTYADYFITVNDELLGFTYENNSNVLLGFLLDIKKEVGGMAASGFGVRLKTEQGVISELKTAKNVMIDGVRCKDIKAYNERVKDVETDSPVRYVLDENGDLKILDTSCYVKGGSMDSLKKLTPSPIDFIYNKTNRLLLMYGDGRASYGLSKEAKIFSLWSGCDSEYMTVDLPQNVSGDGVKNGLVYSLTGRESIGDIFVWKNRAEEWKYPVVADRKTVAVNEDGEIIHKIYGYVGATEVSYDVPEDILSGDVKNVYDSIAVGDCFRVRVDGLNRVSHIELVYLHDGAEAKNGIAPLISKVNQLNGDSLQYDRYMVSTVLEKEDGFLKVAHGAGTAAAEEIINVDGVGVCSYETDHRGPYLKTGLSYANINEGDLIFTYAENATTKTVVIYRHEHPIN